MKKVLILLGSLVAMVVIIYIYNKSQGKSGSQLVLEDVMK